MESISEKRSAHQEVNNLMRAIYVDTNEISDGYHTFGQLYEHRIELFIALCRMIQLFHNDKIKDEVSQIWRSKKHSDGSEWDGWFLLGINRMQGKQITYHLPINKWDDTDFANDMEQAPPFDGHTSEDVLKRIKDI